MFELRQWRAVAGGLDGSITVQHQNTPVECSNRGHHPGGNFRVTCDEGADQAAFATRGQRHRFVQAVVRHECADRAKRFHVVGCVVLQRLAAQQQSGREECATIDALPHGRKPVTRTKHLLGPL